MKKISVKNIIEFRRKKTDGSKKTFLNSIQSEAKNPKKESGGDYWASSLSAISNCYREHNPEIISGKITELNGKLKSSVPKNTKDMYERNIQLLHQYENFDFKKWQPSPKISILKKLKENSILSIAGLPVQVIPNHVFSFNRNGVEEIGAIWFIAKLNGFNKEEVGIFTDILYKYLETHFSKYHPINPRYCLTVDVHSRHDINYSQILANEISIELTSTINDIKRLM
jgi:hypothetical protein